MSLLDAVNKRDIDRIKTILSRVNPIILEETDVDYNTPLLLATARQDFKIAQLLVEAGADINAVNNAGLTPLLETIDHNDMKTFQLLLEQPNLDINLSPLDEEGEHYFTALVTTVYLENYEMFTLLLGDARTDPNAPNLLDGETPLMLAARRGLQFYVRDLLNAGADLTLENNRGQTAYDVADSRNVPRRLWSKYHGVKGILLEAEKKQLNTALSSLNSKFVLSRRFRQGIQASTGQRLQISERNIAENIIRRSEYDNLCSSLYKNINKPQVQALARSLNIPLERKSKSTLCQEISGKLIS